MRRFKGNLLSVGKPLRFETSSSKTHILKLSAQGVSSAIPISVPFAPTDVSANEPGNSQARVTWKAPEKNGGSSIILYRVTSNNNIIRDVSGTLTSIIFSGLTNGTTYTFTVQAINVAGASIASSPSNPVTVILPSLAQATLLLVTPNLDTTIPETKIGSTLKISSDGNVICVTNSNSSTSPYIRIYRYNTSNATWNNEKTITTSFNDTNGFPYEALSEIGWGRTLAVSGNGNYIGIGNSISSRFFTNGGLVEVYQYNVSTQFWSRDSWVNSILALRYNNTGPAPTILNARWGKSISFNYTGNICAIFYNWNINIYKQTNNVWMLTSFIFGAAELGDFISLSNNGNILVSSIQYGAKTYIESSANTWSEFPSPQILFTHNLVFSANVKISQDGTTIIIGVERFTGSLNQQGAVKVYRFISNSWTQIGSDLLGPVALGYFGSEVSISNTGNIIVIGAWRVNDFRGAVYGYGYNSAADNWDLIFSIAGINITDRLGLINTIGITSDATKVVLGVPNTENGSVRIYNVAYDSSVIP